MTLTSPSVFRVYDAVRRAAIFMEGLASRDISCKVHENFNFTTDSIEQ